MQSSFHLIECLITIFGIVRFRSKWTQPNKLPNLVSDHHYYLCKKPG